MSRQEFLQRLREALSGEVPGNVIEENIRYYDEYISTEVRNGAAEDEVIASIGDPRLIAKTIMEASENAKDGGTGRTYYESHSGQGQNVYEQSGDSGRHMHYIDLNKWYWKLLGIGVLILFFFLAASILTGIFSLLMPLMGPLLLVFLIIWFVRGMKR
ncbi:DUF1700 domain-containing protein [Clostridium sp. Marseille-P2415]|uniref:DUF1700 domain-containing protein n=1 Tax=Clostridium sp. Marseille-P2415 TaxID=1805471 RepID=UPI00098847A3|nr:DUF1700 domain-containing protein [Clostridium sp. Marseille-P2415]